MSDPGTLSLLLQLAKDGVVLLAKAACAHPVIAVTVVGVVVVGGITYYYFYHRKVHNTLTNILTLSLTLMLLLAARLHQHSTAQHRAGF